MINSRIKIHKQIIFIFYVIVYVVIFFKAKDSKRLLTHTYVNSFPAILLVILANAYS